MIGHITYLSDEQMAEKFGRAAARGPQLLVRAGIPDRVVPAPPGREVRRVLRRQHLPAHHQGARLLRSGDSDRRRPGAGAGARDLPLPGRLVHHRLALRAGALARDRQGAGRQPPRRVVRRDRRAARPRRVPARRSAVHGVVRAYYERIAADRCDARRCLAARARARWTSCAVVPRGARPRRLRDHRRLDRARRARARPRLRRRQPARVPRRDRAARRATASRSTTPACSRRSATASTCCRATSNRGSPASTTASFDSVILSQTLQAMRHTEAIVDEMLRVGREAIVTFPEFRPLVAPLAGAPGSHAGVDGAALPVVRHAQHPSVHRRRLRCASAPSAGCTSSSASCCTRRGASGCCPICSGSLAIYRLRRG